MTLTTTDLTAELHALATLNGVSFTDREAAGIVAIRIREDVRRSLAVGELLRSGGPFLLLRRGDECWLVPDEPNGWSDREPWIGGLNSVRWIGGPPAEAAFSRVGAPI